MFLRIQELEYIDPRIQELEYIDPRIQELEYIGPENTGTRIYWS